MARATAPRAKCDPVNVEAKLRLPAIESAVLRAHGSQRALTPDEEDVLNQYGELILAYIEAGWPVDTGTSQDSWTIHADVSPGEYGYTVANEMYYASFVHRKGEGSPEDGLWRHLIPEAFDAYKAALIADLQRVIVATEARMARQTSPIEGSAVDAILNVFRRPLGLFGRRKVA